MATSTTRLVLLKHHQTTTTTTTTTSLVVRSRSLHHQNGRNSLLSPPVRLTTSPWTTSTIGSRSSDITPAFAATPTIQSQLQLQLHGYQQLQQRRHYLFLPSDWSELRYRWKLFWEANNTPTKIKLRWQDRRSNYQERLKAQKTKLQAGLVTQQRKLKANIRVQKLRLQRRYRLNRDYFATRYQEETLPYYRRQRDYLKRRYQEETLPYYRRQRDYLKRRYQEETLPYYQRQRNQAKAYYQRKRTQLAGIQQRRREFTKRWSARRKDMVQDSKDLVRGYFRTRVFTLQEYARPDWFDQTDGRPLTSKDPTGRYVNPWLSWSTNGVHSITNLIKWRYQRAIRQWKERGLASYLPKDMDQLLFGSVMATPTSSTTSSSNKPPTVTATPPPPTEIQFTWIGHSTCLIQMGNATILTDPIFSHRCTPFPRIPGVGVAREVPPSLSIEDLPSTIDVCLISHDHYDHLDQTTVSALRDKVQQWVLPKGLPQWLESRCSVDPTKMIELEWWESIHFKYCNGNDDNNNNKQKWQVVKDSPLLVNNNNDKDSMTITCCPAQHWSSRTFFDRCKRLWCGFAVETRTTTASCVEAAGNTAKKPVVPVVQKFFFAGDTGMPRNEFPLFPQIGDFCGRGMYHHQQHHQHQQSDNNKNRMTSDTTTNTLGLVKDQEEDDHDHHAADWEESSTGSIADTVFHPFDLAAIPIGAYDPSFLMQDAHMDPQEALKCARQLQARKSVAIHHGTFALSEEPLDEPPQKLLEALQLPENRGIDFVSLPIGGSLRVPAIDTGSSTSSRSSAQQDETTTAEETVSLVDDDTMVTPGATKFA